MAAKCIKSLLETMKNITVAEPVVSVKSALKPDNIPQLETLADTFSFAAACAVCPWIEA